MSTHKNWIRKFILLIGILGLLSGYTGHKYQDYKKPDVISLKYDVKTNNFVKNYKVKNNLFFETLHKKWGIFEREGEGKMGYITSPMMGFRGTIYLNKPAMEGKARTIVDSWKDIEENSKFKKGNPKWRADYQISWELFKDVSKSKRYEVIYNAIKRATIDHEDEHMDFYLNIKNPDSISLEDQEKLAILKSAGENLIELEHSERNRICSLSKSFKDLSPKDRADYKATYILVRKLGKDSRYELYHMANLEDKLKKAAKEVYEDLKKELGINY